MGESETILLPQMSQTWQQTTDWQPNLQQQQKFQHLYELILSGNRQLNLTRITAPEEFWEKHLWDSLRPIAQLLLAADSQQQHKCIDIGTGGGFPGVPVAIALPNYHVTLLDATRKKIAFLDKVITELNLSNANTLTNRAEQVGQELQHRQGYDIALIRAVAPASVCAEYALPLLKIGGLAILYRGQWTDPETNSLQPVVTQLGGVINSVEEFTTPLSHSIRNCLYLKKVSPTPDQFPRPIGIPTQKPL